MAALVALHPLTTDGIAGARASRDIAKASPNTSRIHGAHLFVRVAQEGVVITRVNSRAVGYDAVEELGVH